MEWHLARSSFSDNKATNETSKFFIIFYSFILSLLSIVEKLNWINDTKKHEVKKSETTNEVIVLNLVWMTGFVMWFTLQRTILSRSLIYSRDRSYDWLLMSFPFHIDSKNSSWINVILLITHHLYYLIFNRTE